MRLGHVSAVAVLLMLTAVSVQTQSSHTERIFHDYTIATDRVGEPAGNAEYGVEPHSRRHWTFLHQFPLSSGQHETLGALELNLNSDWGYGSRGTLAPQWETLSGMTYYRVGEVECNLGEAWLGISLYHVPKGWSTVTQSQWNAFNEGGTTKAVEYLACSGSNGDSYEGTVTSESFSMAFDTGESTNNPGKVHTLGLHTSASAEAGAFGSALVDFGKSATSSNFIRLDEITVGDTPPRNKVLSPPHNTIVNSYVGGILEAVEFEGTACDYRGAIKQLKWDFGDGTNTGWQTVNGRCQHLDRSHKYDPLIVLGEVVTATFSSKDETSSRQTDTPVSFFFTPLGPWPQLFSDEPLNCSTCNRTSLVAVQDSAQAELFPDQQRTDFNMSCVNKCPFSFFGSITPIEEELWADTSGYAFLSSYDEDANLTDYRWFVGFADNGTGLDIITNNDTAFNVHSVSAATFLRIDQALDYIDVYADDHFVGRVSVNLSSTTLPVWRIGNILNSSATFNHANYTQAIGDPRSDVWVDEDFNSLAIPSEWTLSGSPQVLANANIHRGSLALRGMNNDGVTMPLREGNNDIATGWLSASADFRTTLSASPNTTLFSLHHPNGTALGAVGFYNTGASLDVRTYNYGNLQTYYDVATVSTGWDFLRIFAAHDRMLLVVGDEIVGPFTLPTHMVGSVGMKTFADDVDVDNIRISAAPAWLVENFEGGLATAWNSTLAFPSAADASISTIENLQIKAKLITSSSLSQANPGLASVTVPLPGARDIEIRTMYRQPIDPCCTANDFAMIELQDDSGKFVRYSLGRDLDQYVDIISWEGFESETSFLLSQDSWHSLRLKVIPGPNETVLEFGRQTDSGWTLIQSDVFAFTPTTLAFGDTKAQASGSGNAGAGIGEWDKVLVRVL